ncbi:hypothetical protein [Magnetospira sp. QH-2]|uniref:hypothetical protein n=1 Tax=Magnetospira sp. (strain QH-2) TaxID=1288970 RepID=UPI0003E81B6D|nr:hypothetical protein [Magnetospira sp. QH-2]CCQ73724.1 Protein of unknown function [Magnetospira sp. QH-2]
MFLNILNPQQKSVFLALAMKLCQADGKIVAEEHSLLGAIQSEIGWDVVPDLATAQGNFRLDVFDSMKARTVLLLEISLVAVCDGQVPPEEQAILSQIRDAYHFTPEFAERTLHWARSIAPHVVAGWETVLISPVDAVLPHTD